MKIIDFIKNKVQEAGTQSAVARKTGVSQGTIAKILNGDTTPEIGTLYKIAEAYGITLTEFEEIPPYPHGKDKFKQYATIVEEKKSYGLRGEVAKAAELAGDDPRIKFLMMIGRELLKSNADDELNELINISTSTLTRIRRKKKGDAVAPP